MQRLSYSSNRCLLLTLAEVVTPTSGFFKVDAGMSASQVASDSYMKVPELLEPGQ